MKILITSATPKYLNISTHEKEEYILKDWHVEFKIAGKRMIDLQGSIRLKGANINMIELETLIHQTLKQEFLD